MAVRGASDLGIGLEESSSAQSAELKVNQSSPARPHEEKSSRQSLGLVLASPQSHSVESNEKSTSENPSALAIKQSFLPQFSLAMVGLIAQYLAIPQLTLLAHHGTIDLGFAAFTQRKARINFLTNVIFGNLEYLKKFASRKESAHEKMAIVPSNLALDFDKAMVMQPADRGKEPSLIALFKLYLQQKLNKLLSFDALPQETKDLELTKLEIEAFCIIDPQGAKEFFDDFAIKIELASGKNFRRILDAFMDSDVDITDCVVTLFSNSYFAMDLELFQRMLQLEVVQEALANQNAVVKMVNVLQKTTLDNKPYAEAILASEAIILPYDGRPNLLVWIYYRLHDIRNQYGDEIASERAKLIRSFELLLKSIHRSKLLSTMPACYKHAAKNGDLNNLQLLLKNCPELINSIDANQTPLIVAILAQEHDAAIASKRYFIVALLLELDDKPLQYFDCDPGFIAKFLEYVIQNNHFSAFLKLKQAGLISSHLALSHALKHHNYKVLNDLFADKNVIIDSPFLIQRQLLQHQKILDVLIQFLERNLFSREQDLGKDGVCCPYTPKAWDCSDFLKNCFCCLTCLWPLACAIDHCLDSLHITLDKRLDKWPVANHRSEINTFITFMEQRECKLVKEVLPILKERKQFLEASFALLEHRFGKASLHTEFKAPPLSLQRALSDIVNRQVAHEVQRPFDEKATLELLAIPAHQATVSTPEHMVMDGPRLSA